MYVLSTFDRYPTSKKHQIPPLLLPPPPSNSSLMTRSSLVNCKEKSTFKCDLGYYLDKAVRIVSLGDIIGYKRIESC